MVRLEEVIAKKRTITAYFLVIAAIAIDPVFAPPATAQEQDPAKVPQSPPESVTARVDKLFAEWDRPDSPGCSLAVSRNGVLVYERGYGIANLELGVPITPASVFHVASISKQFTAMSLLLLAERGQLSLDDDARKYVTELPGYGSRLTLRHLLTHTSGLRDAFVLQGLAAPREDGGDRNEALVKILARQRALNFTPGSEFEYNNGAYVLLATVVKRVSGRSLRAFADANIFKPLGMAHTHVHDDPTAIVPHRASGYHRDAGASRVAVHDGLGRIVGTTGLLTTARDLLLWEQNFADVRVGTPALVAEMQAPAIATGWSDGSFYGFGLEIGRYRGLRVIGHGGGDPGFSAHVVRYPDQGLAVAVLSNLDNIGIAPAKLTQGVADIFLADVFATTLASAPPEAPTRVSLSANQLAGKVGLYRNPSTEIVGRIFIRDGKLMASPDATDADGIELIPVGANRFVIPGKTIAVEFVPAAAGRAQELRVTGAGPKPLVSQLVAGFAPTSAELRAFAGEYTSAELGVTYTIAPRDTGLVVRMPGRPDVDLQPIFSNAFAGAVVNVVTFSRDAGGAVTGFTVNTSGVRRLSFDRVER